MDITIQISMNIVFSDPVNIFKSYRDIINLRSILFAITNTYKIDNTSFKLQKGLGGWQDQVIMECLQQNLTHTFLEKINMI